MLFFVSLFMLSATVNSAVFDFIDPCHITDNECNLKSAIKAMERLPFGIPELGIPSAHDMDLGDVNGDLGDLKLRFNNMNVKGIGHCKVTDFERLTQLNAKISLECPITATGSYELDGKLNVITVEGKGPCKIQTKKLKIDLDITLKIVTGKDGEEHYKVSVFDFEYTPIEKVYIEFENLYNGDTEKAKPVASLLDSNWKELMSTFAKPVVSAVVKKAVSGCVNKFFSLAPINQIELH